MANSDKNIVIQPSIGSTTELPTITFTGAGNSSSTLEILDDDEGTLRFDARKVRVTGILSSTEADFTELDITTGTGATIFTATGIGTTASSDIFRVTDYADTNLFAVTNDGDVNIAPETGGVGIGTTSNSNFLLDVNGTSRFEDQADYNNGIKIGAANTTEYYLIKVNTADKVLEFSYFES